MAGVQPIDRRSFLRGGWAVKRTVIAISDACLARDGVTCMTCRDACPEQAIRLRPCIGGPSLPELIESACTGCGACLAPCPARAITLTDWEHNASA